MELVIHLVWWRGPAWLYDDSAKWRRNVPDSAHDEQSLEVRKQFQSLNVSISLPATKNVIENEILEQRFYLNPAC